MRMTVFLLKNEPTSILCVACLRASGPKAQGNRVLIGRRWHIYNPKPGELSMTRLKDQ